MILLEVENRGVEIALNNHFEAAKAKGRFDKVEAQICDFDECKYHLSNPDGNREKLQVVLPKSGINVFYKINHSKIELT